MKKSHFNTNQISLFPGHQVQSSSLVTVVVINARDTTQQMSCRIVAQSEKPDKIRVILEDQINTSLPSHIDEIDYIEYILSLLSNKKNIDSLYDHFTKLYTDHDQSELIHKLALSCSLALSKHKSAPMTLQSLYQHPFHVKVSSAVYESIDLSFNQELSTMASQKQLSHSFTSKPRSRRFSEDLTQEEFENCFKDIDTIIDDQEHDELTLSLAFGRTTQQQNERLQIVRQQDAQIYSVIVNWADHVRTKYVQKGYTSSQVKAIQQGEYSFDESYVEPDGLLEEGPKHVTDV